MLNETFSVIFKHRAIPKNIFIWISVQKIDYFRNPYEICVLMTKIDGTPKGSSTTPAKKKQSSRGFLFRLRRWMCAVAFTREEATTSVFVCCGVYKGAFSFNFDLRILLCYQDERRVSNQPRTSTEVAWQNEGLLTQLCCNSWTLPFWNQRRDKSVNLICLSVSWD